MPGRSSTQRRHLPLLRPETPSTSSKGARSLGAPGRRPKSTGSILRSLRGHDARKLATCRRHSSILKVGGKAALRISWSEKVAEKERKAAIKTKEKELLAAKKDRYAVMNPCIAFKINYSASYRRSMPRCSVMFSACSAVQSAGQEKRRKQQDNAKRREENEKRAQVVQAVRGGCCMRFKLSVRRSPLSVQISSQKVKKLSKKQLKYVRKA